MKVVAHPLDPETGEISGGEVTLGDDAAGDYIVGGQPHLVPGKPQVDDLAFGLEVARASRLNAQVQTEWVVSREHDSVEDAFKFEWDHLVALVGCALCHLELIEGGARRFLTNALLVAASETEPRTRSTKFRYSAVAGVPTPDVPDGMKEPV